MLNLRQSKELLDNMKEDILRQKKKTLEDNANYNIYTKEKKTFNPSSNNQQTKQHKTSDFGFCHKSFLISLFWKLHG